MCSRSRFCPDAKPTLLATCSDGCHRLARLHISGLGPGQELGGLRGPGDCGDGEAEWPQSCLLVPVKEDSVLPINHVSFILARLDLLYI